MRARGQGHGERWFERVINREEEQMDKENEKESEIDDESYLRGRKDLGGESVCSLTPVEGEGCASPGTGKTHVAMEPRSSCLDKP